MNLLCKISVKSFRYVNILRPSYARQGGTGEQCTVVFALLVTEPASECVSQGAAPPPP
jgi:hypothetical protein